jgi:cytochrome c553
MFSFRNSAAAVFGLGALLAAYLPAAAQSPADIAVLAGTCANCHGTLRRSSRRRRRRAPRS